MSRSMPIFLVFEGLDGAGKTAIAQRVAQTLGAIYMTTPCPQVRSYREALLRAFGGCQEAAQLLYLATVFAASAAAHEHLASGRSVVLDRYFLSTQAYAEFRGSSLRLDELHQHLKPADMTVYVEATLDIRRARVARRSGSNSADRETLTPDADSRLRAAYAARLCCPVVGRLLTLDTTAAPIEAAVSQVVATVGTLIGST